MFQNTNVVFLNTFNAILNIMDANACVPSVEFIYSALSLHMLSKGKLLTKVITYLMSMLIG